MTVRIEVQDCGPGLSQHEINASRLFTPFAQHEVGRLASTRGSGLGLAIVRQIVSISGGRLGVKSRKGHGSTFWYEQTFAVADAVEIAAMRSSNVPSHPVSPHVSLASRRASAVTTSSQHSPRVGQDFRLRRPSGTPGYLQLGRSGSGIGIVPDDHELESPLPTPSPLSVPPPTPFDPGAIVRSLDAFSFGPTETIRERRASAAPMSAARKAGVISGDDTPPPPRRASAAFPFASSSSGDRRASTAVPVDPATALRVLVVDGACTLVSLN